MHQTDWFTCRAEQLVTLSVPSGLKHNDGDESSREVFVIYV